MHRSPAVIQAVITGRWFFMGSVFRQGIKSLSFESRGIELNFSRCCGAEGICQKCKVRALQKMGPLTPTEKGCLSEEELSRGIRLSCQARVIQDTQVEIINKQHFSVKVVDEHPSVSVDLKPRVKKLFIKPGDDITALEFSASARTVTGVPWASEPETMMTRLPASLW